MIVEGAIAVKAALNSKYRDVTRIFISDEKKGSDISFIMNLANSYKVEVVRAPIEQINQMCIGKTHGGICALVGERRFQTLDSLLKEENPFLCLIEGVEDNFNLGYCLRTLYAFGCNGVIIPERRISFEDNIMIKSSAGASELIPIHLSNDLENDLKRLKGEGIKILSCYRGKQPIDLFETDLANSPILFCLGGPLRGLSKVVLDNSDEFVYIPYANDFRNALNVASAVSVIAAETYRQRNVY